MKRYQFRLDQVLRVRAVQKDQAAAALGAAHRAEATTALAVRERLAAMAARERPIGPSEPSALLAARALVWEAESRTLQEEQAAAAVAASLVEEERHAYLVAAQRVEALEVLDLRRRDEHRIEVDREEAARVDDLVASRHHRRRPGGQP